MTLSNPVWAPHKPWRGGLVERGLPIPDGVEWREGVRFNSTGCVEPILQDPCDPSEKTPTGIGEESAFMSVGIVQPVECSTIGNVDLRRLASERLHSTAEWALGQQLLNDAGALGNPSLSDAPTPTAYDCPEAALAGLLAEASQDSFGAALTAHLTVSAAVLLASEIEKIDWVDFIVSPGYGVGPQIWVTGPTYVGIDTEVALGEVWREGNSQQAIAETLGIAFFDPCVLLSGTFANDCS